MNRYTQMAIGTLAVCGLLIFIGSRLPVREARESPQFNAYSICVNAIKSHAVDSESADVPYVDDSGKGDEFYLAWGASTKHIRLHNRLGLEVPASASCIGSRTRREIVSLTMNGDTIIDNPTPSVASGSIGAKPQHPAKTAYTHDQDGFLHWAWYEAKATNVKVINPHEVWISLEETADASYSGDNAGKEAIRMYKELTGTTSPVKVVIYQHEKPVKEVKG